MALTWAQRREVLLSDCIVSPDVFNPMIDRLAEFVGPYQQVMETEAAQRNLHFCLQGLLSPHSSGFSGDAPILSQSA